MRGWVLAGAKLQHAYLESCVFDERTSFEGADLSGATLRRCAIERDGKRGMASLPADRAEISTILESTSYLLNSPSTFASTTLQGTRFEDCQFPLVDFAGARFKEARITGGNFSYASFSHAEFHGCDIDGVVMEGADFRGVTLNGQNEKDEDGGRIKNSDLSRANLFGSTLENLRVIGSKLRGVNLEGGSMSNVVVKNSILEGAQLSERKLEGVVCKESDLNRTRWGGSSLKDVLFRRCSLDEADFSPIRKTNYVTLQGGPSWREVTYGSRIRDIWTDFTDVRFHKTSLRGASFKEAEMKSFVMREVDLDKATFAGALIKKPTETRDFRIQGYDIDVTEAIVRSKRRNPTTERVEEQEEPMPLAFPEYRSRFVWEEPQETAPKERTSILQRLRVFSRLEESDGGMIMNRRMIGKVKRGIVGLVLTGAAMLNYTLLGTIGGMAATVAYQEGHDCIKEYSMPSFPQLREGEQKFDGVIDGEKVRLYQFQEKRRSYDPWVDRAILRVEKPDGRWTRFEFDPEDLQTYSVRFGGPGIPVTGVARKFSPDPVGEPVLQRAEPEIKQYMGRISEELSPSWASLEERTGTRLSRERAGRESQTCR